jgi:uncharacterized protein YdcH (DUF465 family)
MTPELMQSNDEYRKLAEQHSQYDRRLGELAERKYPTPEEQAEEMRLKKLKLHAKDRMYSIVLEHRRQAS